MSFSNSPNGPPGGLFTQILSTFQNLVISVGSVNKTLATVFPQTTGTAGSATSGAATLPGNPVGFLTVTLPNGTAAKVPYYGP
jgi:hypothetical protein